MVIAVLRDAPPEETQCSDTANRDLGLAWHDADGIDQCAKDLTSGSSIIAYRCLQLLMPAQ